MDFASLMKSAISKEKSKSAPKSNSSTTTTTTSSSKYARRSDLESAREAAYRAEQEATLASKREKELKRKREDDEERERAAVREAKKRRLAEESRIRREEEEARAETERRKRLGLPPLVKSKSQDADDEVKKDENIPEDELRVKLRELKEPVLLFAESHAARVKRYRELTAPKTKMSEGPIPTALELLPESECEVPAKPPGAALKDERKFLYRQLASYFTIVLTEWERALAGRTAEVRESYQGRQALGAYVSSRENMRPLFRTFEKGNMDDKVLEGVVEIANAAQRRRYVDASDAYLRLSIGKAAWPIGVTMVGIHERSAREKLHEHDQKAHIMSDEVTRKYLQAIKQCLSFAQTRWPPDDHLQLMG